MCPGHQLYQEALLDIELLIYFHEDAEKFVEQTLRAGSVAGPDWSSGGELWGTGGRIAGSGVDGFDMKQA